MERMPPDTCNGIAPATPAHTRDDLGANRAVSGTLQIHDMDEGRFVVHDSLHERLDRLAKEDVIEFALFKAYGVIAQ